MLDPLSQFIYVRSSVEQESMRSFQLLTQIVTSSLEQERLRSREAIAAEQTRAAQSIEQMRLHYQTLDQIRSQSDQRIEAIRAEAPAPAMAAISNAVAELADRLDQLGEEDENAVAPGEDATDAERILAGVSRLVSTIAESPLGEPIGRAITAALERRATA
ncbi:MAG: hypothetical protein A2V88_08325 [Elusimicrobia bacterium RBG_16_66_12]|nr:MAG: hypothetical protein A2V88_08325 [Elusimicrobia bacterium RBG_16_66_12]